MKANIPSELETMIYEYIYSRMLVEVLNKKMSKETGENSYKILENRYKRAHMKMLDQKKYLKERDVKVDPMEDIDDMFSIVRYFVGFKEGDFRFWKAALRMELKRRFKVLIEEG